MKHTERQFCDSDKTHWTLIGHSMGAKAIAATVHVWKQFHKSNIGDIDNVIIVSGACHETQLSIWLNSWILFVIYMMPSWLFSVCALLVLAFDFVSYFIMKFAYGNAPDKADLVEYLKTIRLPKPSHAIHRTLTLMAHSEGASMLEMNRAVPRVLVVWGEKDKITSFKKGKALYWMMRQDEE